MFFRTVFALSCLIFWAGCGQSSTSEATPPPTSTADITTKPNTPAVNENAVYAWVNNLNIRKKPATDGKVITTVEPATPLTPTGEQTQKEDHYLLRGTLYQAPWIEVETPDQKRGWVFGGAVKKADEEKGNPPISATDFTYPHFAKFNLADWKLIETAPGDGEGDFDTETRTYERGRARLEVYKFAGEYGYGTIHTLKDLDGNVLKKRTFRFSNDIREISEEVIDFGEAQPMRYHRKQSSPVSSFELTRRPLLVDGDWESEVYQEVQ